MKQKTQGLAKKTWSWVFAGAISLLGATQACAHSDNPPPLETVPNLDLDRYLGTWNQVAAIPAWFQKKCVKNTQAKYARNQDGTIKVTNTCEEKDGKLNEADGIARINPEFDLSARLEVTFFQIFGKWVWQFAGDYWVIELDQDYRYVVVGSPSRKYLWILAREKTLDAATLRRLESRIAQADFDTCSVRIDQLDALQGKELCKVKELSGKEFRK